MTDFTGLRFIAIYPNIPLDGKFILRDLPGSGKRIDVLCRSLAASFDWSPKSENRERIEFWALLSHSLLLKFSAPEKSIPNGETWWASIIKDCLTKNPPSFVSVEEVSIEELLKDLRKESPNLYVLEENGEPLASISEIDSASQYSFMLGNHHGLDERTSHQIQDLDIQGVSLGQRIYLGSHCIAAVISHFERMKK
jgi:tRNA (pseudouridine54-N1)-methyltransferase